MLGGRQERFSTPIPAVLLKRVTLPPNTTQQNWTLVATRSTHAPAEHAQPLRDVGFLVIVTTGLSPLALMGALAQQDNVSL